MQTHQILRNDDPMRIFCLSYFKTTVIESDLLYTDYGKSTKTDKSQFILHSDLT